MRALKDFAVADATTATHENGDAGGGFDDFVVDAHVVGRIGLDDVGTELDGLTNEVGDGGFIAVDHVATGFFVRLKHKRLHHHRHAVVVGLGLEFEDVLDAFGVHFGCAGDLEEVHADAGGVVAHGLEHAVFEHEAEAAVFGQRLAVNVRHVGAQHEAGLLAAGDLLQMARHAERELDRVRGCLDECLQHGAHVLDAMQEASLVEEAMIDGDVEAAVGLGVEEAFEAEGFHGGEWAFTSARAGGQLSQGRSQNLDELFMR